MLRLPARPAPVREVSPKSGRRGAREVLSRDRRCWPLIRRAGRLAGHRSRGGGLPWDILAEVPRGHAILRGLLQISLLYSPSSLFPADPKTFTRGVSVAHGPDSRITCRRGLA